MTDVIAFCVLLVALTVFVAAPLYGRSGRGRDVTEPTPGGDSAAERALAELEIDRASGLIDEAGFRSERRALAGAPEAADLAPETPSD